MNKNKNLIDGKVLPVLVKFTIPILLTILLQIAYGTADLFIVGQFSDVNNVSGVSIGSQLSQIFTNACVGISMGTTVLIGRYVGSGEKEKASKVVGTSIFTFAILAIVCTTIIVSLANPLITLMQAPAESFEQAKSYLIIAGIGSIFIVAYNLLGSVFRGIGDSKTPLIAVAIACVANILLDLLFVAGLQMGSSGAATATVIAQGISVLLSVIIIKKKGLPFKFKAKDIGYDKEYIKDIFTIGIPAALQMVLASFSFLVISSILNSLGVSASAAVGIVGKITAFILIMPQAFGQALSAFTAQNIGAQKPERASKALKVAILISVVYGFFSAYVSFFHGEIFTHIFNADTETTICALSYMKAYSLDCLLVAFMFNFNGYFNGCGRTKFVMYNSVIASFLVRIPVSYLFSTFANPSLFLIGLAVPISSLFQVIISIFYFRNIKKASLKAKTDTLS
ncbi:MAG: MATE family efflux transporter [Clostridia bacterium]